MAWHCVQIESEYESLNLQGEAFVPDSIVRVGSRLSGREGVHTYEVHDKRVR